MAKYEVTLELAEILKAVRVQHHVTAKAVAEHIGKSQSYMSKLEKGDIKTIDESELTSVFRFIYGNNEADFESFFSSSLEKILDTLELRYSDEEIREQNWFHNYDTVQRLIPVPSNLIDDLYERMVSNNISIEYLCKRINSNEAISPKVNNTDRYPFNEWQSFVVNHKIEFGFIKMKLNLADIEKLFSKQIISTNYVTMLSIAYYVFKIETYGSKKDISDPDDIQLMDKATEYLSNHQFYSIASKNALRKRARSKEEYDTLLSSFDKENSAVINELLKAFRVFSELDIAKTNEYLTCFVNNLRWDSGFMLKLISTTFYQMEDVSFSVKKEMLTEIQSIFSKYKELPETQKRLETYD